MVLCVIGCREGLSMPFWGVVGDVAGVRTFAARSLAISTLRRRLSAIWEAHVAAQVPNSTVWPVVRFAW